MNKETLSDIKSCKLTGNSMVYQSCSWPFLGGKTHFENEKLVTHLEYQNYKQMFNYKYKLKVKVWNYLAR